MSKEVCSRWTVGEVEVVDVGMEDVVVDGDCVGEEIVDVDT